MDYQQDSIGVGWCDPPECKVTGPAVYGWVTCLIMYVH